MQSSMKIVLTGATGFIGRHLCAELAATPHALTVLCRDDSHATLEWLASRGVKPNVVKFDLADKNESDIYNRIGAPDLLIHLAWAGVNNARSPAHMTEELSRQYAFLGNLVAGGLPRLAVAGSCSEYGLLDGALKETRLCNPSTPYGLAKYCLLRQLGFLRTTHSFELLWARPFFMYGEGQNPNSIYPQLLHALANREPEFRMSGGEQLRDYLPVEEVARILRVLALSRHTGVVNVCSGQPVSVRAMVERWLAERNAAIRLNLGHYPYRDFEPMAFWGDTGRLHNLINS
jgi:dTDP-6-deoxy-L-talose 4-dehydrogenase (NAD+)